jgi:hypothetical protein
MRRWSPFWLLALAAALAAGAQAWVLRWTCDDAFISFRYAQHFVDGHGLVFNLDPDEAPVEGYTNFAWTMWLALGLRLGFVDDALEMWSAAWGSLCHAGTVLLLAAVAWRGSNGRAIVPIAACGYAALHHAASLAPAGLETALFVLLVLALLRFALSLRCAREAWLAGFVAVVLAMTRPDGALFVAATFAFVAFDAWRRRAVRLAIGCAAPLLCVFGPYLLWRHAYYGYWVPNTFYAKSAADPYPGQGLRYVVEFARCYWALLPALPVAMWFVARKPDPLAPVSAFLGRRPWFALLAFVLPYLAFVVWVGGDFMFARFLLPIVPVVLLAFDFACLRWRAAWLQPALAAGLAGALLLRAEPAWLGDYANPNGFSDNRAISLRVTNPPLTISDVFHRVGDDLRRLFAGLDVRIAIAGSHANLAHRTRVPVAIECVAGLTDACIAHRPIAQRGTVGHEKSYHLVPGYLERRGVHFMFELGFHREDWWRTVLFPTEPVPIPARLVTWDAELMRELKRRAPGMQFADFPEVLDRYLGEMKDKSREQVRADYAEFTAFYFDHNDDPARRRVFEDFLR